MELLGDLLSSSVHPKHLFYTHTLAVCHFTCDTIIHKHAITESTQLGHRIFHHGERERQSKVAGGHAERE